MRFQAVVVLLPSLFQFGVDRATAFECTGMGRRYCGTAHRVTDECPLPCQPEQCRREDDTRIPSNGVQRYRNWDWIDLVQEGHYDYVYVQEDYICLASCWYKPWESTCVQPDPHANRTYCRKLTCKHDEGNRNNHGDRYSGCHSDRQSGQRKEPWHRPTCKECAIIFPDACGELLVDDVMGGTSESMTTIKESSSDTKKDDSSEGSHGDSSETDSKDSSGSGGSNGVKANAESPNSTEAALEDDYGDYDDLEDAPGSWQELFMDEIHSGDAVTAVVNVVMQLQGKASEFNVQALTKSIADYAGVPPAQVTLMHVWDGESNNSSFNYTAITTVSLALVVADPRTMIEHLYQLSDSGLQVLLSTNAGIKYLEQSMSAGIKYIALSLLEPQGPGSSILSVPNLQQPGDSHARWLSGPLDRRLAVGVAAGGVFTISLLTLAAVLAIMMRSREIKKNTPAEYSVRQAMQSSAAKNVQKMPDDGMLLPAA